MTEFKSEMSEDYELLFFDTFSQTEITEGPNLGLVQFENPIVIKEIRVIPLGTRVEADFPGGSRLGATNPSSFDLQFFINDLTRRNACTFLDIGSLNYKQNFSTTFIPNEAIPTDGLILRGMYSTLTLSVFGYIADISSIIANDPLSQSSDVVPDLVPKIEPSVDFIEDSQTERIDSLSVTESVAKIDEKKVNQIIKSLTENSEESLKKRRSPTVPLKIETHESSASSLSSGFSDLKKKERSFEKVSRSRQRSKERGREQRHKKTPISASHLRHRSRSKSKSKSRSTTPNSLKRYRYSHQKPSSPFERSPKRHQRSPRRHRSRTPSPRSPLYSHKTISRSPLSPPLVSRPRSRSGTKSPVMPIVTTYETNQVSETVKSDPKPTTDNLTFDDSELFEPLSPEGSLSDIAEKISDDENLDQILFEEEKIDSQSKDDFDLEEISSEEEYEDDGNVDNDLLMDYSDFELSAYIDFGAFNPFQCEFTSLQTLKDPSLSVSETIENEAFDSENESKLKELITSFGDQRNEKWIEGIEQISLDVIKTQIKEESVLKTLMDFIVDGIDFDLAMEQTNTAYKVRHLKAGIKLSIALSQTSDEILKPILELNIIHKLLELYNRPYMTIPVRLLIIRGIDVICDSPSGIEHLITQKYDWTSNEGQSSPQQTCYQRLLDILVEKPSTRIVVSLTNLLNKIHFFELLKYLSKSCDQINETSSEDSIAISLNEITLIYKNANSLLSQPLRSLPAIKLFEVKSSPFDSYKAIYRYFKYNNTIDCLTNIISGKTTPSADILENVLDLLISMSNFGHGLRFLLSSDSIDSTNNLYKVLIQQCDDSESQIQSTALKLIYRLQVLQLVDMIFAFHSSQEKSKTQTKDNFDDPDIVATLHSLYTMLFTGIGKDAVVQVLSSENNFDAILPFIYCNGEPKKETLIPKSVSCGCALELCLITLQLIDTNLMNFLDTYGQTILKVCENESIPKVESLSNWLTPIKNISYNVYNENTFKCLMSFIKKHYELNRDSSDNTLFTISPELITTLRILQTLCTPSDMSSFESDNQLKHRYALIQIFSSDGLSQLVFLLNKLCETYLKPSHQSVSLIGSQGSLVVNFIKPTVLIIKSLLTYLVVSRATDFKDVSPIPVLLRTYSVLSLVPSTTSQIMNASLNSSVAQQIQYEICEILLIYTELNISSTESDEAVNKSVWTKMIKHLIDYTLSTPLAFIHGLTLLSEVLPQSLPLIVKQPLLSHEVIKTVNFRKLWSLHLHVLSDQINEMVSSLITSNTPSVQLLLKRVCAQLCDLSAPTVNIISKSVYESLISSLETFIYSTNESKGVVCCPTVRILNVILDLSSNTPFRLGFVSVLSNGIKKEEKNSSLLARLQAVLNKSAQIESNESLNFILQPNPDSDVLTSDSIEANKSENIVNESTNSENVINYFTNRPVFVLEDDQTVRDWLSVLNEDSDQIYLSDAIKIDLLDLTSKYFGTEFDIRTNLEKLWSEPMNEIQTKENDVSEKPNILPFIRAGPKEPIVLSKRIQAPRGRGRAFTRLNDPFRSRPPNTSRPPSMHVDDFVALERNDPNPKRVNKEFVRPNRGGNAPLRSFGANQRSSNVGNYRPSPSSARNPNDRYNREMQNRMNKNDPNFPLRWNRLNENRYDFRYPQYSRSFPRQ